MIDFKDIHGQEHCKRALEVAIVGHHQVLLIGPKQSGKSMLREAATAIDSTLFTQEMWPCKCGYFTDPENECNCTPRDIQGHLTRFGEQMLAQFEIQVEVPRLKLDGARRRQEDSKAVYERILGLKHIQTPTELNKEAGELVKLAILELGISSKCYDKIIRTAGTIAKMDKKNIIEAYHISEAISYRSLDRNIWG